MQPLHRNENRFDSVQSIPKCVSKRRELHEQSSVNAMTGLFSVQGDNPRYRSQVYNRALLPRGQGFKMRIATNPGLHGVRKDVHMRDIRILCVCVCI